MTARFVTPALRAPSVTSPAYLYRANSALQLQKAKSRRSSFVLANRRRLARSAAFRAPHWARPSSHWTIRQAAKPKIGDSKTSIARLRGQTLAEYLAQQELNRQRHALENLRSQAERNVFNGEESWAVSAALLSAQNQWVAAKFASSRNSLRPAAVQSGNASGGGVNGRKAPKNDPEATSFVRLPSPDAASPEGELHSLTRQLVSSAQSLRTAMASVPIYRQGELNPRFQMALARKTAELDLVLRPLEEMAATSNAALPDQASDRLKRAVRNLIPQTDIIPFAQQYGALETQADDVHVKGVLGNAYGRIASLIPVFETRLATFERFTEGETRIADVNARLAVPSKPPSHPPAALELADDAKLQAVDGQVDRLTQLYKEWSRHLERQPAQVGTLHDTLLGWWARRALVPLESEMMGVLNQIRSQSAGYQLPPPMSARLRVVRNSLTLFWRKTAKFEGEFWIARRTFVQQLHALNGQVHLSPEPRRP